MGAVALLLILLAGAAQAHVPDLGAAAPSPSPSPSSWRWNLEPWLAGLLVLAAGLYARGVLRLWGEAGRGRGIRLGAVWAFAGGWVALVVALSSPLDALGQSLFSAHMVQHEILMIVAAPLLVLGRPLAAWTWAFERPGRKRLGAWTRAGPVAGVWSTITDPMVAWALHGLALWGWHLPGLFGAALLSEPVHVLQHLSFFGTALLFWWPVLGHDPRSTRAPGAALAYLFTTMLHTGALGALLTLAPTPWYAPYLTASPALGIDPLEDQQLGGLVMWVPAGLAYVVAALAVLGRLLTRARA